MLISLLLRNRHHRLAWRGSLSFPRGSDPVEARKIQGKQQEARGKRQMPATRRPDAENTAGRGTAVRADRQADKPGQARTKSDRQTDLAFGVKDDASGARAGKREASSKRECRNGRDDEEHVCVCRVSAPWQCLKGAHLLHQQNSHSSPPLLFHLCSESKARPGQGREGKAG